MVKIKCSWSTCVHNTAIRVSESGYCTYNGEIELQQNRFCTCDSCGEEVDFLNCNRYKFDKEKDLLPKIEE